MALLKKRTHGLSACAAVSRSGNTARQLRHKSCGGMCPKPECDGCRNCYGWVSPEVSLHIENHIAWHLRCEAARRSPPYQAGQSVRYKGTDCRFQRYRTHRGRSNWCVVSEKKKKADGSAVVHPAVREAEITVPRRNCPLPSAGVLAQLHYGKAEFLFLRRSNLKDGRSAYAYA